MENRLHMTKLLYLKSLTFVLFLLLSNNAAAPDFKVVFIEASEPVNAYGRLIKAVVQVESMGDTLAFNVIEEAIGAFQIRPIRLKDYNKRTGKNYKSKDCYNFEISKEIFLYYAKKLDYHDYETIARNWNGSGIKTQDYWKKVKKLV